MSRTLVIAEPGGTAEGDYAAYVRLINTAAQCGADVLKAQWVSDPEQMCARRHITPEHPKYRYYRKAYGYLSFPVEWHADFSRLCKQAGIAYGCTAFLPQDCATIAPHAEYIKLASFEAMDSVLRAEAVEAAVNYGRFLIISTGICTADEADEIMFSVHDYPFASVLACTSSYPAPVSEMHLEQVRWLDGLSDHSRNWLTGAVAVGVGASIIEAHFRLYDCSPENPDYEVAFDPGQFAHYILNIRTAEKLMGDGVKKIQPSEEWALPYRVTA